MSVVIIVCGLVFGAAAFCIGYRWGGTDERRLWMEYMSRRNPGERRR